MKITFRDYAQAYQFEEKIWDRHYLLEEYPIISRLYMKGIGEFLEYAAEKYDFKASETGYASKCELCYEIRWFLVVDQGVDSHELQPRGHYLYD